MSRSPSRSAHWHPASVVRLTVTVTCLLATTACAYTTDAIPTSQDDTASAGTPVGQGVEEILPAPRVHHRSRTEARGTWPGTALSQRLRSWYRNDVVWVQRRLNYLGYGTLEPDGYFGPATARAVTWFQEEHGLTVDAVVGPQTWRALFLAKPNVAAEDALPGTDGTLDKPLPQQDPEGDDSLSEGAYPDMDCSDFASHEEAQDYYEGQVGDPDALDRDGDGLACEWGPNPY